jgi:hypothetical protein
MCDIVVGFFVVRDVCLHLNRYIYDMFNHTILHILSNYQKFFGGIF